MGLGTCKSIIPFTSVLHKHTSVGNGSRKWEATVGGPARGPEVSHLMREMDTPSSESVCGSAVNSALG